MNPMPLPIFLALICGVIVAAGVTIWVAAHAGVPLPLMAIGLVLAAALARLFTRVE
ncbi:MAG TPA: hypothetical protein VGC40_01040 [Paenirhodobacter sp.]